MLKNNENIFFVGVLQDLGIPFVSLCVDKENSGLLLFVRESDDDYRRFFATNVSGREVRSYMNEIIGLNDIFANKPVKRALIDDNEDILLDDKIICNFVPTKRMLDMNMFDAELCDDELWLKTFLKRVENNKPLEIA